MKGHRQRMCNKRCFTPHEAEAAIEKARKSRNPNRKEKRFYACAICKCFHLTSHDQYKNETEIILKHKKDFKKYLE